MRRTRKKTKPDNVVHISRAKFRRKRPKVDVKRFIAEARKLALWVEKNGTPAERALVVHKHQEIADRIEESYARRFPEEYAKRHPAKAP